MQARDLDVHVLGKKRHTCQGTAPFIRAGRGARRREIVLHHGVESSVQRLDAFDCRLRERGGGDLAPAHQFGERRRVERRVFIRPQDETDECPEYRGRGCR